MDIIVASALCFLIQSASLSSLNPNTNTAIPNASQAARLIDAGSTITHNAQEMEDKITKVLSYHFCALRFWITYVPRIASRIAIKPPYGPGLAKLPVITNPTCPETRKPRT